MQLVDRTVSILLLLGKKNIGLSLTEISEELDISTSSTFRILQDLIRHNFVSHNSETKRYLLGYKVLTIGTNNSINNSLTMAVRPYLEELAKNVNETVALCVLEDNHIICIDYVESKNIMQLMVRTGVAMPPLVTSAGKAILAYGSLSKVKSIYENIGSENKTDLSLKSYNEFLEELKIVSEKGYAFSNEELQVGVQGIAAPLFGFNDKVVGSISITGIKTNDFVSDFHISELKATAEEISKTLGAFK